MDSAQILILADDVTGCFDAAAPFAAAGAKTAALTRAVLVGLPAADVVAVSTNSRALDPAAAAKCVSDFLLQTPPGSSGRVFKKIDSTGKGNIGSEAAALLHSTTAKIALVCPAFPAQGRQLVNGLVRVVSEPDYRVDLQSAVAAQTDIPIACVSVDRLARLATEEKALDQAISASPASHKQIWLMDAAGDEHLAEIASLVDRKSNLIAVGSAGLARVLASRQLVATRERAAPTDWQRPEGYFAAVIGTTNRVTHQQIAHLRQSCKCTVLELQPSINWEEVADADRPLVILNNWRDDRQESLESVINWLSTLESAAVFISGGDMAHLVFEVANTTKATIRGEVVPGIPWAIADDGGLAGRTIVTKAGGFGAGDILTFIYRRAPSVG